MLAVSFAHSPLEQVTVYSFLEITAGYSKEHLMLLQFICRQVNNPDGICRPLATLFKKETDQLFTAKPFVPGQGMAHLRTRFDLDKKT